MTMKVPVYTIKGESRDTVSVAKAFGKEVRTDIIRKAVNIERANARQPYGSDPLAGQRSSAHYHGRRGIRDSMMNREMSRMQRIHNQGFLNMTARIIPGSVKGRRAHPPKVEKVLEKKMNRKELALAVSSAISASAEKELVSGRGHRIGGAKHIPLIIEDKLQELKKSKEISDVLKSLGLEKELERVEEKKLRAGKGKLRGRKYRRKVGPLLVVKEDKGLIRASKNLQGVEAATISGLSVEMLAPGGHPGRLIVWGKSAIEELDKKLK